MTMRRAHYTWRNDPGTTNKWRSVTVVTNLCPTITYLAPAAITNYISQTRRRGRKNLVLAPKRPRKSVCFPFFTICSTHWHWFLVTFLSSGRGRSHGRMPTFFHLWPDFHLSYFFQECELGRKEKSIFLTYSELHPWDIALPAIVNVHFNFGSGHTIFLFGWFCTNTSPAHIAICIFQRHISLLFKFPVCYFQIF